MKTIPFIDTFGGTIVETRSHWPLNAYHFNQGCLNRTEYKILWNIKVFSHISMFWMWGMLHLINWYSNSGFPNGKIWLVAWSHDYNALGMNLGNCRISLLKALIQPAYLARVASWLAFVVAIFMVHENGDNKGQPRDGASKACWLNKGL